MTKDKLIINPKDNVGVCLVATDQIPAGHKFALVNIKQGEPIVKYGQIIGRAKKDIKQGEWVHTQNVVSHLDEDTNYTYSKIDCTIPKSTEKEFFMGYKRAKGRAGIRNEIYIIPTVGCVNNICKRIEKISQKYVTGSIDGIFALTHQFGCSQLGEDNQNIKMLLSSIALNPNASFVLFVGLGCENNSLQGIKDYLLPFERDNIAYFNCQDVDDELTYALDIIKEFAEKAKDLKREEVDFSELAIGLKCGGSDGFSGITANPLVGKISDRVISAGGSAILTEVPEMFGAEQILMNKCKDKEVFENYKKMIIDFKNYYISQGFPVYENPSPGNKAGGITTLEEKSCGCVEKAGNSEIVDVLSYGDTLQKTGLTVYNAPGNDLIASTALASAGCQVVLFTTGRGTPFSTFVPTLKIASNNTLARKKNNWIDFDASTSDEDGLFAVLKATINGEYKAKSEDIREIAFYKNGVTL